MTAACVADVGADTERLSAAVGSAVANGSGVSRAVSASLLRRAAGVLLALQSVSERKEAFFVELFWVLRTNL